MYKFTLIVILSSLLLYSKSETDSVKYYVELFASFMKNSSKFSYPTSVRDFFQEPTSNKVDDFGEYDFIIVGAGIGGSVVANRLTESGRFRVLVLEAGGIENDFTDIPGIASLLVRSEFNWGYKTIPQKNCCLGMKDKRCNYPRGKGLGGSSIVNFMIYVRGNKEDFNLWGAENPGWDYEGVLPYFMKSENSTLVNEEEGVHGHGGPLSVEHVRYYPKLTETFLEAVQELDRPVLDYNGVNQIGYSHIQSTTDKGRRCSSYKAFLKPAMERTNLQVVTYALVTKILVTQEKKAYGIVFLKDGKLFRATATKEIIISGGTINSPQLLMLSGIGPKSHLESLDIPVVKDLPVGEYLHDHLIFPAMLFSTNATIDPPDWNKFFEEYLQGSGPLTAASALTGIGFASPRIPSSNPSVEYAFMSGFPEQIAPFFTEFIEVAEENWKPLLGPLKGKVSWTIIPILLHPKSTGSIKLKSKDPLDFPLHDPNMYSDPGGDDFLEMLSIIEDIIKISKAPAFQKIGSKYESAPFPACGHFEHLSQDYWKCALKQISYPILHGVASCKMGSASDKTAVVDSTLKVHGVASLRVIDASVMPFSIASHPAPSTFMIAEKGADIVRKEHGDI